MRTPIRLYCIFAVLVVFVLTACTRPASGADFVQVEGLERSTETPLPLPTTTAGAGVEATVIVTQEVEVTTIVEVLITTTPEPTNTPSPLTDTPEPTLTEVAVAMAQPDSEEALPDGVSSVTEEELALREEPEILDEGIIPFEESAFEIEQEQDDPSPPLDIDPVFGTATALVLDTTFEAQTLTATALGPAQVQPTFTPTPDPAFFPTEIPTQTPDVQQPPPPVGGNCIHEVRAGENLFRLSMRYGVTVNEIAAASGVQNIQLIVVGQRLTIPGCGTTGVFPPPTSIPPGGTASTQPGTQPPVASGTRHTVQQGETLFQIAMRYGVTVNDIVAVNPSITNPNFILMTTEIVIPGR